MFGAELVRVVQHVALIWGTWCSLIQSILNMYSWWCCVVGVQAMQALWCCSMGQDGDDEVSAGILPVASTVRDQRRFRCGESYTRTEKWVQLVINGRRRRCSWCCGVRCDVVLLSLLSLHQPPSFFKATLGLWPVLFLLQWVCVVFKDIRISFLKLNSLIIFLWMLPSLETWGALQQHYCRVTR